MHDDGIEESREETVMGSHAYLGAFHLQWDLAGLTTGPAVVV